MLVDPSGDAYGKGLATGLASIVDLYYVTTKNNIEKCDIDANVFLMFYSGEIKNKIQKVIKGVKYIKAYLQILRMIKKYGIDVIHIEWLLVPKLDVKLLKMIRNTGIRLVFTAHNVLPHRNSELYIDIYNSIYSLFDEIIVHGEEIKREFLLYYPQYSDKLKIEKHGVYIGQSVDIDFQTIDQIVVKNSTRAKKTIIFFGNIFFNKGLDRLLNIWFAKYSNVQDFYLIIVGKKDSNYSELNKYEQKINESINIYYKPVALDEIELNTYISLADIIVMPYRHASMSGIIFKAAEMRKTVLTTDVGSINEYIDDSCGFIVENQDELFKSKLVEILENVDKKTLCLMGEKLFEHIHNEFDWNEIAQKTISEVYFP